MQRSAPGSVVRHVQKYHRHIAADTFMHILRDRKIMFSEAENTVWGVVSSLSGCHLECLGVQDSQSEAAK